jgi:hypothetical protein
MTDSKKINSNTQNAGHLMMILGLLVLFIIATICISVLMVNFMGEEVERPDSFFWPIIASLFAFGIVLLIIANRLKSHHHWARYAASVIGTISLIAFPVGTVMGLFILSYLYKGWEES